MSVSGKKQRKLKDYKTVAMQFHLPTFVTLFIITMIPLLYTIKLSFFNYQIAQPGSEDQFVGFANYVRMFSDVEFFHSIRITFIFMAISITAEAIIGMLLALALNRIPRFKKLLTSLILIPMMVAPVVIGLMYSFYLNPQFGLYVWLVRKFKLPLPLIWTERSWPALLMVAIMDIWEWAPYMGLLFLAGIQSIDGEYYEAARVDGASAGQIFRSITMPLMKPVVTTGLLLRAMECFKKFDEPWILTGGGPGNATEVVDIYTYRQAFSAFQFSYAAAICVFLFIVLVLFGKLYQWALMRNEL